MPAKPLAAITGASSGIGAAFARKLADTHDLLLIARRADLLEALASELRARGANVTILTADLSEADDLKRVAERIAEAPSLAMLVNNAGFGDRGAFWDADPEVLDRMHRLHIGALVRLSHAALRRFVPQNHGAIINLASVAAFARRQGSISYGVTKTWVVAFTEGLYVDLKSAASLVYVQALCPGYTYSEYHGLLNEDRSSLAPPSLWLSAEQVVEDSLKGMVNRKLYVVPGWRYKVAVAFLRVLPLRLQIALTRAGIAAAARSARPAR